MPSITLQEKALAVIEHLALEDCSESESVALIYQAAHIALGQCKYKHEGWLAWLDVAYEKLVARGSSHDHSNSLERLYDDYQARRAEQMHQPHPAGSRSTGSESHG